MTNEKVIYIDESGNPEYGINDNKQLFFTIASHSLREEKSADLIRNIFKLPNNDELKYNGLILNENNFRKCNKLITSAYNEDAKIKVYVIYKPFFMLKSMLLNFHEPSVEGSSKHNNYGDPDFEYIITNQLWFELLEMDDGKTLKNIINSYCKLIQKYNDENINNLKTALINAKKIKIIDEIINHLANEHGCIQKDPTYINTPFTCLYYLLKAWSLDMNYSEFNAIHDQSSSLPKHRKFFIDMYDCNTSPILKKSDNDQGLIYICNPEISCKLTFGDSKEFYGLQVADILAGYSSCFFKTLANPNAERVHKKIIYKCYNTSINNSDVLHIIPDLNKSYSGRDPFCFVEFTK